MFRGTEDEFNAFLDTLLLNTGFAEFERLCRDNNIPLIVLSDGIDLYIRYLLGKHDLSHIPVHSNIGRLENGGISIEFPYPLGACGRCGNCKGDRIAEYRRELEGECRVVFVGDGLSDTCAIAQADILFAKKDLKRYCIEKKIRYYSYDTFEDITAHLMGMGWLRK